MFFTVREIKLTWSVREVQLDDVEAIVGILNPIIAAECTLHLDTPFTVEAERVYLHFPPAWGLPCGYKLQEQKIGGVSKYGTICYLHPR